jgi:excisionase family DNA binding protein
MPDPAPPRWLSIRQAADRAGVSTKTVKRWIRRGLLPATRLPSSKGKGHLRVRLGDFEAVLARGALN